MSKSFANGLLSCITDPGTCLLSCFGMPLVVGKNAETVGENGALWALASMTPCTRALLRTKIRKDNGISGSLFTDLLAHCCCPCCAVTQEARHVNSVDYLMDDPELNKAKKLGENMQRE